MKQKITMYSAETASVQERFSNFYLHQPQEDYPRRHLIPIVSICTVFQSIWILPRHYHCFINPIWNVWYLRAKSWPCKQFHQQLC